jgi:hypothetical protein
MKLTEEYRKYLNKKGMEYGYEIPKCITLQELNKIRDQLNTLIDRDVKLKELGI